MGYLPWKLECDIFIKKNEYAKKYMFVYFDDLVIT